MESCNFHARSLTIVDIKSQVVDQLGKVQLLREEEIAEKQAQAFICRESFRKALLTAVPDDFFRP